jgi:hypothetical protein
MSAWGGLWLGLALAVAISGSGWHARVDCAWLKLPLACDYVNAQYQPKPHNPQR